MSSVATVDYYRRINERVNEILGKHEHPEMLLYSVNFGNIERFVRHEEWDQAGKYLAAKASALQKAGADFIALGSNTMHRVAPVIQAAIDVPLLHIVDVLGAAAKERGAATLGIIGTLPVMESTFYSDRLDAFGIRSVVPPAADRRTIDRIIFDELTRSIFAAQSRRAYVQTIGALRAAGADAVALGCTEIGLLVTQSDVPDIPLLDTTALHVEAIVQTALSSSG